MINHQPEHRATPDRHAAAEDDPRFALLVILAWLGIIFLLSVAVPPLEQVAEATPGFAEPQRCTVGAGDGDHRQEIQGV